MKIKITRYGLQIVPTERPVDDIIIEEALGLYNEGDQINLVRVSGSKLASEKQFTAEAPPLYILEAEASPIVKVESPILPCPFCGADPELLIHETKGPNNSRGAHGKIVCINSQCPAQPQVCDDRIVVDVESMEKYEATIISLWNKRAKC